MTAPPGLPTAPAGSAAPADSAPAGSAAPGGPTGSHVWDVSAGELSLTVPVGPARLSLRDEAIGILQAALIVGELRPAVVYSVPALAARMGMSATPVREAMLDLAKEGLVEPLRNKGFRVVERSVKELDELTDLRAMLEVPTVRRIAERGISSADRRRLTELATAIERAAHDGELIAHHRADLDFHDTLLALDGNDTLVALVRSLRIRSRLYGQPRLAVAGALGPSAHEHARLVELIGARDSSGAEMLMRQHIGHIRGAWATGATDTTRPARATDTTGGAENGGVGPTEPARFGAAGSNPA